MTSVQFAVSAGDTYLRRTSNVPPLTGFSLAMWARLPSGYTNYIDLFALEGGASEYFYIEGDNSGTLYLITRTGGGGANTTNLWTDTKTQWRFFGIVCNGSTVLVYGRDEADSALTLLATHSLVNSPFTPTSVSFGALALYPTDTSMTARYAGVKLWDAQLTQAQLLTESDSLAPVITSGLTWANDMQAASTCQNDESASGDGNFSKTGTPTDNADSPTISGGSGVTATIAASIATDFVVAASGTHTAAGVSGTIAVAVANDFTVSATASERIPSTIAVSVANDFTVSATASQAGSGVTSTIAATIASDFTVAGTAQTADPDMLLSTSGHTLVADGAPKFLMLDAAWSLAVRLTRAQVDDYLDTRQSQGFNGVIWQFIESGDFGGTANAYGHEPFLSTDDFASPNPAYWSHVDYIQGALAKRGMYSLANGLYLGFGGGSEGWFTAATAAGATEIEGFGAFQGLRYKDHPQMVWGNYGDYLPASLTIPTAYRDGIETHASQLLLNHLARDSAGTDAGDSPTLNSSYTDDSNVFTRVAADWADSPTLPTGHYEGRYQGTFGGGPTLSAEDVRRQAWHAATAGATYVAGGNHTVWQFETGWDSAIDSDYGSTIAPLPELFASVAWHTLEPQASGVMVTSGESSGVSYVSAAKSADDTLAVLYFPDGSGSSATVALGQMVSAVRARWYDPTDGSYQTAGSGTYVGAGNTSFTKPGANAAGDDDWVLLLEQSTAVSGTLSTSFDLTVAGSLSERIPSTLAVADIASSFTVAATQSVANPVTSTGAVSIGADFVPAMVASESVPSTVAVSVASDFTVAAVGQSAQPVTTSIAVTDLATSIAVAGNASHSVSGDTTIVVSIGNDFTVSATGAETIPATLAVTDLASNVTVAATATETIPATVAVSDLAFVVSASVTHTANDNNAVISFDIGGDFGVAAYATSSQAVSGNLAFDISQDFHVAAMALVPVPFTSVRVVNFTVAKTPTSKMTY